MQYVYVGVCMRRAYFMSMSIMCTSNENHGSCDHDHASLGMDSMESIDFSFLNFLPFD